MALDINGVDVLEDGSLQHAFEQIRGLRRSALDEAEKRMELGFDINAMASQLQLMHAQIAQLKADQNRLLDLIEQMVSLDKTRGEAFDHLNKRVNLLQQRSLQS